jgi:Ca-activated chloride channel family protein
MTFNPMLPVWLLVAFGLLLVGYVMFALVRAEGRARLMWVGRLVLVLALVGAIARPGVGSVAANVANDAVDVVFVVDTSPSIAAEDWDGGEMRLDAVKDDIAELAAAHPGARYALITFGRTAVQRLPFTNDATALQESVNQLAPDDAYYAMGSSPFAAADLLEEVLQGAADADTKGERARLVYYLGDGEDTGGDRPLDFSDSATLIQGGSVLGYGTEAGGRMRAYDEYGRDYGDYIYDTRTYEDGISVIDEGNLDDRRRCARGDELRRGKSHDLPDLLGIRRCGRGLAALRGVRADTIRATAARRDRRPGCAR